MLFYFVVISLAVLCDVVCYWIGLDWIGFYFVSVRFVLLRFFRFASFDIVSYRIPHRDASSVILRSESM
jgi:hypothetical protein